MALRCLIVDDSAPFLEAASKFLEREGIMIVGVASTGAEALERAQELRPDVALVDIDLGEESGFDLARQIAEGPAPFPVILISTRSEEDLAELIEASPALGYVSKAHLSAHAVADLLGGGKCVHEALVYSTVEEFLAATVPFIREGLEEAEPLLVVTKEANLSALRETLDHRRACLADISARSRRMEALRVRTQRRLGVDAQLGRLPIRRQRVARRHRQRREANSSGPPDRTRGSAEPALHRPGGLRSKPRARALGNPGRRALAP